MSGMLLPWYIVEVKIVKQSVVEYRAEDGKKYIRRHGMTEEMEERNVKCLRCGGFGHLARNCPSPPSCYHCSEIGHRASNCPKNDFFFNNIKKVSPTTDTNSNNMDSYFCRTPKAKGHSHQSFVTFVNKKDTESGNVQKL